MTTGAEEEEKQQLDNNNMKPKAVVVGGSIAGICTAHALIAAGWDVAVLEKSTAPPSGSPTGAGLGLEPLSRRIIGSWLGGEERVDEATVPLEIDQNLSTDEETKTRRILTRDEKFNFRAGHWADLHSLLHVSLPPDVFLWGHQLLSFCVADDKGSVSVKAKVLQTGEVTDIVADLLVAADGCLSSIRQHFLPNFKLRYSGYCAEGFLTFQEMKIQKLLPGYEGLILILGNACTLILGHRLIWFCMSFSMKE